MIDTAHIFLEFVPRYVWPGYLTGQQTGSMLGKLFSCAGRCLALMQLAGCSWDQARAAWELLQGCACQGQAATWGPDPYRSSTGLAFAWSRWGHVQIVIQEERCMAGTEQRSCLVSRCEVTWHSVVCRVRERGKCETAAGQGMLRLSNQLDEVAATHFTSCRHASLSRQKAVLRKKQF